MTDLKEYRLFSEWRGRVIYGESLPDALQRAGKLQRPDKHNFNARTNTPGEWCKIKTVLSHRTAEENSNSTRGAKQYETVLVELEDSRIEHVDAHCEGTWKRL